MATLDPEIREQILDIPALETPPGVIQNLDSPENLRTTCFVVIILLVVLTSVILAIQVYTKVKLLKRLEPIDYMLYIAFFLHIGAFLPLSILVADVPSGVHQWNIRLRDAIEFQRWCYFCTIFYCPIVCLLKVMITLMITRLFTARKKGWLYRSGQALIWLNITFWSIIFFVNIFSCTPIPKIWDKLILEGSCIDKFSMYNVTGAFNFLSDFCMLLLPHPVIWKLNMPLRRKLGLSVLFLFGFLASVIAALRLYYTVLLKVRDDQIYIASELGLWIWPELTFGFIIACLPCFPRFFRLPIFARVGLAVRTVIPSNKQTYVSESPEGYTSVISYNRRSREKAQEDTLLQSGIDMREDRIYVTRSVHVEHAGSAV